MTDDLLNQINIIDDNPSSLPYHKPPMQAGNNRVWGNIGTSQTRVLCWQKVIEDIELFARSDDHEVGGMLLGEAYRDNGILYLEIQVCLHAPSRKGQSSVASFTFTPETWAEMNSEKDHNYPHLKVVGWFHSHPGHHIFLSDYDLEIHTQHFKQDHHTALVYDPVNHEGGFFIWHWGSRKILPVEGFIELFDSGRAASIITWRNQPGMLVDTKPTTFQQPPVIPPTHPKAVRNSSFWNTCFTATLAIALLIMSSMLYISNLRVRSDLEIRLNDIDHKQHQMETQIQLVNASLLKLQLTITPTRTATPTSTMTRTVTPTITASITMTPTPTLTETLSSTTTVTKIVTETPTTEGIPSPTVTLSPTSTPIPTALSTNTRQP